MRLVRLAGPALVLAIASWAAVAAQETAAVYQGEAAETFLTKAKIVKMQSIALGVTAPRKATLELNGVTHQAAFKTSYLVACASLDGIDVVGLWPLQMIRGQQEQTAHG